MIDFYSCLSGNSGTQADAVQAYPQADHKGPPTWLILPNEAWPEGCDWGRRFRCPVVMLEKALYGHPDAGGYWEEPCERRVRHIRGFNGPMLLTLESNVQHVHNTMGPIQDLLDPGDEDEETNIHKRWKKIRRNFQT